MPDRDDALYYLIRRYDMTGGDPAAMDAYLRDALLPAAGRLGIGPIGAFTSWFGEGSLSGKVVILPGRDLAVLADLEGHLSRDADYVRLGAPFLAAEVKNAPFARMRSSLLRAMPGLAQMQLPDALVGLQSRLFELRHYEQPTHATHDRKVDMFIEGEAAALDAAGLTGIMYGVDLVGEGLPRLTYMWAYPDLETRQKAETTFFTSPEARAFMMLPRYAGVPSTIHNTIMRPTDYSQI